MGGLDSVGTQAHLAGRRSSILRVLAFAVPLVAAAIFQLLLPASLRVNESTDYTGFYLPVAENLADGRGLTTDDGAFADRYPPGYSLVLAAEMLLGDAFGIGSSTVITAVTLLAYALGAFLLSEITRTFLRPEMAFASALAWGLSPIGLWLVKQPNSEVVFTAVFLGAVLAFARGLTMVGPGRSWWLVGVGLLLGVAALIRPVALGAVIPFAITMVVHRKGVPMARVLAAVAVLCLAFVVAVLPWEISARQNTGAWIPLSTGGPPSIVDGLTFESLGLSSGARQFMSDVEADQMSLISTGQVVRYVRAATFDQPAAIAQIFGLKAARSWYATDSGRYEWMILVIQVPFLLLAVAGVRRARRHGIGPMGLLAVLLTAYFWVMTIGVLSIVRYMTVPIVLLTPFVALGLQLLIVRAVAALGWSNRLRWVGRISASPWLDDGSAQPCQERAPTLLDRSHLHE